MNATPRLFGTDRSYATKGNLLLIALVALGLAGTGFRFIAGLGASTNLSDAYPWGLWKVINVVAGIAVAGGGFTMTAYVYVFHRDEFHALARPTLLAAALCYTFAVLGLVIDLGRYYNIWHPILPSMWQPNSVLFEIAMCVMSYLTIMYIELAPVVCERFVNDPLHPRLAHASKRVKDALAHVLFLFLVMGVVISCLHQSSLGNLMLVAPSKMHPLWYTPILSLLFLLSSIASGFPMVIVVCIFSSWALKLRPPLALLASLARNIPILLALYLGFKLTDMVIRESYVFLASPSVETVLFAIEIGLGVMLPLGLLLSERMRSSATGLIISSILVLGGVILNRIDVFLVAYRPPFANEVYYPSWTECAVSAGLFATLILLYRVIVKAMPVITERTWRKLP